MWMPDRRLKALVVAAPKTGKTGSVAALANAGYRVIVAAFDPGYEVLLNFVTPENHANLIILPFEDRKGFKGKDAKIAIGNVSTPVAFAKFAQFLNDGRARQAPCQGGEIISLEPSDTWGLDTVLVVDNLTSLSDCAMDHLLALQGRDRQSRRRRDWGLAADEVDNLLIQMASSFFTYHLVVLAHHKVQGPQEFMDDDAKNPDRTDYTNEIREAEKDLIPTKQVPVSIGRKLSANLIRHFPSVVWAEVTDDGKRVFNLSPSAVRDSGVPVPPGVLPKTLSIETGLLSIFEAVTGKPKEG
jgi:hypothetical protein